jgi:predicted nucleotidyltransferase
MLQLTDYITQEALESFCRANHIKKLSLFGSALRDELSPESDIDLLVEFEEDHMPGLITLAGMEIELSEIIGRKIDIRSSLDLSRFFRDKVLRQAKTLYENR